MKLGAVCNESLDQLCSELFSTVLCTEGTFVNLAREGSSSGPLSREELQSAYTVTKWVNSLSSQEKVYIYILLAGANLYYVFVLTAEML